MATVCRVDVFFHKKTRRGEVKGYGYQLWNPDPVMEKSMARLQGSGSFYWPDARAAWKRAHHLMRTTEVDQIKIETISGVEVARLYRPVKELVIQD